MRHAQSMQLAQAHKLAQLAHFQPERSEVSDLTRVAKSLPLSIASLQALGMEFERMAWALYQSSDHVNVDAVHACAVDAIEAIQNVECTS